MWMCVKRIKRKRIDGMVQAKRPRGRRKIPKTLVKILYFAILAIPFVTLSLLISSVSTDHVDASSSSTTTTTTTTTQTSYLPNENAFSSTFKECINMDTIKCKQYIPSGTTRPRIAVLAPPGEGVDEYFKILNHALFTFYGSEETMSNHIDLFQSSHVPPYGYGKTHGITKIIRIRNGSLMNQATEAISKWYPKDISTGHLHADQSHSTLSGVLQQMIRWHCRLNHVSAHTFVYNINIDHEDIIHLTSMLVKIIVSDVGKTFSEDVRHEDPMKRVDEYLIVAFQNWSSRHESILKSHIPKHVIERLDTVLMKELNDTKNLTQWPCLGFWDVQDIDSQVVKQIATELVPDCNAKYTKCTVKKDFCEERGDKNCFN